MRMVAFDRHFSLIGQVSLGEKEKWEGETSFIRVGAFFNFFLIFWNFWLFSFFFLLQ